MVNSELEKNLLEFRRRQRRVSFAVVGVVLIVLGATIAMLALSHIRTRHAEQIAQEQKAQLRELAEATHLRWDMRTERPLNRTEVLAALPGDLQKKVISTAIDLYEHQPPISYTWGGKSPSTGFDSSGFVAYALSQAGLPVNPATFWSGRLRQYLKPIRVDERRPGDVIFYPGGTCMFYLGGPDDLSLGAIPGGIATGRFDRFATPDAAGRY